MHDLDDFYAFMLTSENEDTGSHSSGCGCLPWLVIGLAVLWIIGKL